MAEMWFDVDIALGEVPVNIMSLIDSTDFITREESVTFDQAGMDLVWNFTTTANVFTQTAVTPTTAGVHDWTNQGNGMYTLEIPASAGTINNDTEGFGWFTGFATGILPWRGPIIGFRAAGLNNKLIDDAYSATLGLAGTALPDAVADAAGGLPISDLGGLDMDAILADTNSLNDTKVPDTISLANINAEVDTALTDIGLDHLLAAAVVGADITDDSIIASIVSSAGTADWDTFANTTDSLEAIAAAIATISVSAIADAVWDELIAGHLTAGSTGERLNSITNGDIADAVWDEVIEAGANANSQTARQILRIMVAALAGADADAGDWSALGIDGIKTRIAATLTAAGKRSAVGTLDGST